eukprot:816600-Prymnesium_polylepis.1
MRPSLSIRRVVELCTRSSSNFRVRSQLHNGPTPLSRLEQSSNTNASANVAAPFLGQSRSGFIFSDPDLDRI